MAVIADLGKTVFQYIKNSAKLRSLTKDDLEQIIDETVKTLECTSNISKNATNAEVIKLIKAYEGQLSDMKVKSKKIPLEIHKRFGRGAMGMIHDKGHNFAPIFAVNKKFITLLKEIKKNLDKLIVDDTITIFNTRLSHVALLGIIRQADFYGIYTSFLWAQVVSLNGNPKKNLPGYRVAMLIEKQTEFVELTNLICEKMGRYTFLNEMENMKKKNTNMLLYSKGDTFDAYVKEASYNKSVRSYFKTGIAALNIFAWVGEMIDDFNHWRYLRNQNLKEWLESHNALLKLELAGKDENDPEYRRLENIINSYDDMISKYDRKINEYMDEN